MILFTGVCSYLDSAEVWDPTSDRWCPAAPMLHVRSSFALGTLTNGSVVAAGGYDGNSTVLSAEMCVCALSLCVVRDYCSSLARQGYTRCGHVRLQHPPCVCSRACFVITCVTLVFRSSGSACAGSACSALHIRELHTNEFSACMLTCTVSMTSHLPKV